MEKELSTLSILSVGEATYFYNQPRIVSAALRAKGTERDWPKAERLIPTRSVLDPPADSPLNTVLDGLRYDFFRHPRTGYIYALIRKNCVVACPYCGHV